MLTPIVQTVMEEFAQNMRFSLEGLPGYGLAKVAGYAATVARAQALGVDVDDLMVTTEEFRDWATQFTAEQVYEGVPVVLIDPSEYTPDT